MIPDDEHSSRKRRPRVYGFRTFADPCCPVDFSGAFRDNIREFVRECAESEDRSGKGKITWCTMLVDEKSGAVIPLYVVEDDVALSTNPLCDHCRSAGWSHHLVARRRYHVIIPADDDWDRTTLRPEAFERQTNILHGLIHCSGFGHLIRLNGREGGSHFLSGRDVMDLWDRLCYSLRVREITVEDSSRWKSTDLRLLLGVAHGTTWFGRWGYTFRAGSSGISPEDYQKAVDLIGSINLDRLIDTPQMFGRESERLKRIIIGYRKLARSSPFGPQRLHSLSDLVRFLLDFRRRRTAANSPEPPQKRQRRSEVVARRRDFDSVAENLDSRWPVRRLKVAAQVIVDALEQRPTGMTRQEVRDAARMTIGDTGLLDFVLKSIGDTCFEGRIVRRSHNPATRVLEFSLEDEIDRLEKPESPSERISRKVVERDIAWVYRHLLVQIRREEAEIVLNCNIWGKIWDLRDEEDDRLRFLCGWMPEERAARAIPPPELLVLPPHATVRDLREEAEKAMRDTYCVMENFRATEVEGVEGGDEEPLFVCGVQSGARVWVRGRGARSEEEGMVAYEGGESWKVRCVCGVRDDDGERMVACDICEVWQHTKCVGIAEGAAVPPLFLCWACGATVLQRKTTTVVVAE